MVALTEVEQRLVDAVRDGVLLDLSRETQRSVRSWVIRDLAHGKLTDISDPRGVRLKGAQIDGSLDLADIRASHPLVLLACELSDSAVLSRAHLPHLDLSDSLVKRVVADSLRCEHDVFLRRTRCQRGVVLTDATIGGQLSLRGGQLANLQGAAFEAERITVGGGIFMDREFHAEATTTLGAIHLLGATIAGELALRGAHLTNRRGPALHADRIRVDGSVFLDKEFHAEATTTQGAIRLAGATIGGDLTLSAAHLNNPEGPALHADRIRVDGSVFLDKEFHAEATTTMGTIRLAGATIGGQLNLSGAHLANSQGSAMTADSLTVNGSMVLDEQFHAEATTTQGAIRLPGATIGGQLSLRGAHLTNPEGPALTADRITVNGDMILDEQFHAESTTTDSTIRLSGATIGGQLTLREAMVCNHHHGGLVLNLADASIKGAFALPDSVLTSGAQHPGRVNFDGLRYPTMPRSASLSQWLVLLREQTADYAAQPYQQLATVHRAAGHERDARCVLIAQQQDLRRRGDLGGPLRKALHACSGALIGYGHRPWRALAYLLAVLGLAVALALSAGAHQLTSHPKSTGGAPCSTVENLGLAADLAIPLLNTGSKQRCEITTTTTAGQWHLAAGYVLQVLGWAFATLFVAGYTGIIRKT